MSKLQIEYHELKAVLGIMRAITGYGLQYEMTKFWGKRDIVEDSKVIWGLLQELDQERNNIKLDLYNNLPKKGYDPISHDNIETYKELLIATEYTEFKKNIIHISRELEAVVVHLDILFRERESQLIIMGKYFF